MKKLSVIVLMAGLASASACQADAVVAPTHDNTGGMLYGGAAGMMLGSVAGPIGALAGAGLGALVGRHAQEAAGLSQRAYLVKTENGDQIVVRSPNKEFSPGQTVVRNDGRLQAVN